MNIHLLHKLAQLIVLLFERGAPVVEKAAVAAAVGAAEADPKVQAIELSAAAMIAAAHDLKAAMDTAHTPPAGK